MKTTILILFTLFCLSSYSQTSDILWVPDQKSLVASMRPYHSPIGLYVGGYYTTNFPPPYLYRTTISIINRMGVNIVGSKQKWGIMGGVYIEDTEDYKSLKPDVWLKIYPLKILTNTSKGFDFVVAVNYMDSFRWGVGISIPFRGIY
jgi:hypothetical protein